jgi:dTDP-4-dehydrorhamnose 3,5-epimerase
VAEVFFFTPKRFGDNRGWFEETYNARRELNAGISDVFVQDNLSFSATKYTIRGIHFQLPPNEQAKLVRCSRGRLIDYVIDLRKGSPTYGNHLSVELSREGGQQIYIPIGFGHAFVTLEDGTEISYKVSDYYAAAADGGIRWDCPDIGIEWPIGSAAPTISAKDQALPLLKDFESPFQYDGDPLRLRIID